MSNRIKEEAQTHDSNTEIQRIPNYFREDGNQKIRDNERDPDTHDDSKFSAGSFPIGFQAFFTAGNDLSLHGRTGWVGEGFVHNE